MKPMPCGECGSSDITCYQRRGYFDTSYVVKCKKCRLEFERPERREAIEDWNECMTQKKKE